MKQLTDNQVITNHVVAINARDSSSSTGTDTVVKFGGWDKEMTATGELMILETIPDVAGNT